MFADQAKITIISGKGGDGHVSFRREKYVAAGGPDGGDGGKGGSVIFEVDKGLNTLVDFRHIRKYQAEHGEPGKKRRCTGKSGEDLIIKVPEGTVIREAASGKVIADMSGSCSRYLILKGGRAPQDLNDLLTRAFRSVEKADAVPGAGEENCGNYLMHNLPMAKWYAEEFVKYLEENKGNEAIFEYPKTERLVTEDGQKFFDS